MDQKISLFLSSHRSPEEISLISLQFWLCMWSVLMTNLIFIMLSKYK